MATLTKIDKNGSKYYEGMVPCDRCGGQGGADAWKLTGYTCWKCQGSGQIFAKWIERTPEYEAVLAARRAARIRKKMEAEREEREAFEAERKAEEDRREADRRAEEDRIRAEKEKSQHVGQIGQKITTPGSFIRTAWFTVYDRFGREGTMYVHTFRDPNGNALVWKTGCVLDDHLNEGDPVTITGTIKEHTTYKEEKQTRMIRCKVSRAEVQKGGT